MLIKNNRTKKYLALLFNFSMWVLERHLKFLSTWKCGVSLSQYCCFVGWSVCLFYDTEELQCFFLILEITRKLPGHVLHSAKLHRVISYNAHKLSGIIKWPNGWSGIVKWSQVFLLCLSSISFPWLSTGDFIACKKYYMRVMVNCTSWILSCSLRALQLYTDKARV